MEIPLVHQYYSPTDEEVENAKELLRLDKEARENNQGVAIMNGKFIGPFLCLKQIKH